MCADPDEYRVLTDDQTLDWLGAVSGDIVHFVWMIDRHGKPALSVKRAIIADLRDAGIEVPDNDPILLFVTIRREGDDVIADIQGTLPILGRLDTEKSKEIFTSIVRYTKQNAPIVDTDRFVAGLRSELAALYALKYMPVLKWLCEVLKKIFAKKLGG